MLANLKDINGFAETVNVYSGLTVRYDEARDEVLFCDGDNLRVVAHVMLTSTMLTVDVAGASMRFNIYVTPLKTAASTVAHYVEALSDCSLN